MTATHEEAEKVAKSMPVGFGGGMALLILIEIIYYSFQLWKSCSTSATYSTRPDGTHDADTFRLARRRVRRAAKYHGQRLSRYEVDELTMKCLDYISDMGATRLAACCLEPCLAEVDAVLAKTTDQDEDDE